MRFTHFFGSVTIVIVMLSLFCGFTSGQRNNKKLRKRNFAVPSLFHGQLVRKELVDTLKDWVNVQIHKGHASGRQSYNERVVHGPDLSVSASGLINSGVKQAIQAIPTFQPIPTATTATPTGGANWETKMKTANVMKALVDNAWKQELIKLKLIQQQRFLSMQYHQQQFKEQQQFWNELELRQQKKELETAKAELEKEREQLSRNVQVQPIQQFVPQQSQQIGVNPLVPQFQQIGQNPLVQSVQQNIPPPAVVQPLDQNAWKPMTGHTINALNSISTSSPQLVQPLQQLLAQPFQQNNLKRILQPLPQVVPLKQVQPLQQNTHQQQMQPPQRYTHQQQVQPLPELTQQQPVQPLQQFTHQQQMQQLPPNIRLITLVRPHEQDVPKPVLRLLQQNGPPLPVSDHQTVDQSQPVQFDEVNIAMEPPAQETENIVFQDPPLGLAQDAGPAEICNQRQLGPGKVVEMRTQKGKYCKVKVIQWETCQGKEPISVYSNNFPGACKSMNKVMTLTKAVSLIPGNLSNAVLRRLKNKRRVFKIKSPKHEN